MAQPARFVEPGPLPEFKGPAVGPKGPKIGPKPGAGFIILSPLKSAQLGVWVAKDGALEPQRLRTAGSDIEAPDEVFASTDAADPKI